MLGAVWISQSTDLMQSLQVSIEEVLATPTTTLKEVGVVEASDS